MARKPIKKRVTKKKEEQVALRVALLVVWFLAGLYVGLASWSKIDTDELIQRAMEARSKVDCSDPKNSIEYKGSTYCTLEGVAVQQRSDLLVDLRLGWVFKLPDPLPMFLTTFAFGAVGSLVRIFRIMVSAQKLPSFYVLSLSPALGGMTALMLIGLLALLPHAVSNSGILLKPPLIPFLSLFAGAFSDYIQKWFQTMLDKVFGVQKENTHGTPVK